MNDYPSGVFRADFFQPFFCSRPDKKSPENSGLGSIDFKTII
jgi:hypothetical protein